MTTNKPILLTGFLFLSSFINAQNLPACDSLIVNCCAIDSMGPNTITLYATNFSSELFDYPGFVLFDANMDTIAKETVNYFGIGTWTQPHTLNVLAPLNLPFTGYLNLYMLFYQEFACSFPITISDTATGIQLPDEIGDVKLYPNPFTEYVTIEIENFPGSENLYLSICDLPGREILRIDYERSPLQLRLKELDKGIYFLRIRDAENKFRHTLVLVHQ